MRITRPETHATSIETIAAEAFVLGYPLVLMARARAGDPVNAFRHGPAPPDETAETGPCHDVLTSSAWLDVSAGPVVLSVPDSHGHYYVLTLVDMWTVPFASVGARTTGTGGGRFAIWGPRWAGGALPAGVRGISSPTDIVRIAGQTRIEAVPGRARALRLGYRLDPLDRRAGPPVAVLSPPAGAGRASPAAQVEAMDASTFLAELAVLLERNPPRGSDAPLVALMRRHGVIPPPGERPHPRLLEALERGAAHGLQRIRARAQVPPATTPAHWRLRYGPGPTDGRLRRAAAAYAGLPLTPAADELPAVACADADGRPLSARPRNVLRFDADGQPPVHGFWSLTACGDPPRAAGRFASIGDANGLTTGLDGSLSIYIQAHRPARREQRANWLPVHDDAFRLVLRLFWPLRDVLERRWAPPPVIRVG